MELAPVLSMLKLLPPVGSLNPHESLLFSKEGLLIKLPPEAEGVSVGPVGDSVGVAKELLQLGQEKATLVTGLGGAHTPGVTVGAEVGVTVRVPVGVTGGVSVGSGVIDPVGVVVAVVLKGFGVGVGLPGQIKYPHWHPPASGFRLPD